MKAFFIDQHAINEKISQIIAQAVSPAAIYAEKLNLNV